MEDWIENVCVDGLKALGQQPDERYVIDNVRVEVNTRFTGTRGVVKRQEA